MHTEYMRAHGMLTKFIELMELYVDIVVKDFAKDANDAVDVELPGRERLSS